MDQFVTNGTPACVSDVNSWCNQVWQATHVSWLADSASWLVAKPLKIVLILAVALVIRFIAHRMIDRLTRDRRSPKPGGHGHVLAPRMSERRAQRAQTVGSVLKSTVSFLVLGVAGIMILGELGLNLAPIIASAGIVGVAVGFGAQNLVKDFLSGVFMLLEDQYGVGDVVDVGPATGTVEEVGLRITTVRDGSGTVWYVRNGSISRIGNSSQGHAVAVVDVPLPYAANLTHALDLLNSVSTAACGEAPLSADVLEPPKTLGVQDMDTESMTLRVTVKVRPGRQWATQRELRRRIMIAFGEAGIEPLTA
ncbi:MAG TPA: mechanosensitive ion channel family protein [Pseudonocardiaceae bacterium]|nr:mechanosensitive ion channel family protein [Pseudonocardiaceae bacterium]